MTNEERDEFRALILDTVGGLLAAFEKRFEARLDDMHKTLLDVQVDASLALDKLDGVEIDVRNVGAHQAKVSREHIKDRLRLHALETRVSALEADMRESKGRL